jgi:hypothetical protein
LGAHLAEMDALLREIQMELAPDREPAPVLLADAPVGDTPPDPPDPPEPPDPPDPPAPELAVPRTLPGPDPRLEVITEVSTSLLASMRELLAGYERMLVGRSAPRPSRRVARRPAESRDVTLSAAPFSNLEALHAFERAVSELPGVREVAVQGYEGTDRAILAVRLDAP